MVDLKNYVCVAPFLNMEIHNRNNLMCCGSWLTKELPNGVGYDMDLWNSEEAQEIRKSVMDGSYRHCLKNQCPYLSLLTNMGDVNYTGPIARRDKLDPTVKKWVDEGLTILPHGPEYIQFAFDRTCNYWCPSCRKGLIAASGEEIDESERKIKELTKNYGPNVRQIYITGSGDPFVSVPFRNFLRNFIPSEYPKLERIHLHTNASRWTKEMWDSMPNIHKYVKTCEVSIDAGTKETYENVTRLGGKWDVLMKNLEFINTIPSIFYISTSFVVQSSNYKEMSTFLELMKSIFGKKVRVFFSRINNWGSFTDEEYEKVQIWNINHPEYNEFIKEYNKVVLDPQVTTNMHELIEIKKSLF